LANLDNVIVDGDGPVQTQIYRAAVIIQRSCSTAIEAGMALVPTVSPQWVPAEMEVPAAEEVSIPCMSYEKLRSTLQEILGGTFKPPTTIRPRIEKVINTWFYRADGLANKRVSDTVSSCLKGPREVDERICKKFAYNLEPSSRNFFSHLAGNIRQRFGLSPDWSFRQMRKVPTLSWNDSNKSFGVAEVQILTDRVREAFQAQGHLVRPVRASLARLRGDYLLDYHGHSITLSSH
jgi:hypothetical protein